MKLNINNEKNWTTLLVAEIDIDFPNIKKDGFVEIPIDKRRSLESALETIANVIGVFGHAKREISSAHPCVSLVAESNEELDKLDSTNGIYMIRESIASAQGSIQLDSELLSQLQDRLPAVALLAEAQSHSLSAGKFHEYVRLFEYAFALQFSQVKKKLLQFLSPAYGYTSEEIMSWISIRDPLTHADGKKSNEIFLDSDARKFTQRMEQAAYDVLFNKNTWHDRSSERRKVWSPIAATSDPSGSLVIRQGSEPKLMFQLFDEFGVFPKNLNAIINDLPDNWWCKMGESLET